MNSDPNLRTEPIADSNSEIADSEIADSEIAINVIEVTPEPSEPIDNTTPVEPEQVNTEEFRIQGDELVAKIKTLIHEGNIRRIILKNEAGHTLIEIPLTVGVVGGVLSAAFFPVLAAVGAIGAVVAHLTLVIEKREA